MIKYRYLSFVTNVVIVLVIASISIFALISTDMISSVSADDENLYYNGNKDSNYENKGITRNEFCGGTKKYNQNYFIPIEIEIFEIK